MSMSMSTSATIPRSDLLPSTTSTSSSSINSPSASPVISPIPSTASRSVASIAHVGLRTSSSWSSWSWSAYGIENLTPRNVPAALDTIIAAFSNDRFNRYARGEDMSLPPPAPSLLKRLYYTLALHWFINRKITLTTTSSGGHALLVAYPPASMARTGWRGVWDRIWGMGVDLVFGGISWGVGLFDSGRVKRRRAEIASKQKSAVSAVLGEREKELMYVHILATHPGYQGQGHGGKLLDAMSEMTDSIGMSSWLLSSGPHNVPFYEKHGYRVVGEIRMGGDDPDWEDGELIAPIMVRECRTPEKHDT
ncbi:hypothetical protein SISSUDRAFT_1055536 [Sistotremastrum suecicum HHB10207 ss-3]|uniref:N-acetyltransferase domain-containing protein n=1 Tax=Sistotremastrum suecicum HHB10207 ss-3 TaxID=1314776 RepID=A0A165XQA6_9AGAM|nr:hypothetical protein SISSUDRAFT_1055536 [Sistotremastrum suecicum HHB10207 ss-3]